jgi:hypothetical protein
MILATLAVAFAAVCVWLAVRIVNRRERWAKWTLAAVVSLPMLYIGSFGPACWISRRLQPSGEFVSKVYSPVIQVWIEGPLTIQEVISQFVNLGMAGGHAIIDGGYAVTFQ